MDEITKFLKACKYHPITDRLLEFPENFDYYVLENAVKFGYLERFSSRVTDPGDTYSLTSKGKWIIDN